LLLFHLLPDPGSQEAPRGKFPPSPFSLPPDRFRCGLFGPRINTSSTSARAREIFPFCGLFGPLRQTSHSFSFSGIYRSFRSRFLDSSWFSLARNWTIPRCWSVVCCPTPSSVLSAEIHARSAPSGIFSIIAFGARLIPSWHSSSLSSDITPFLLSVPISFPPSDPHISWFDHDLRIPPPGTFCLTAPYPGPRLIRSA